MKLISTAILILCNLSFCWAQSGDSVVTYTLYSSKGKHISKKRVQYGECKNGEFQIFYHYNNKEQLIFYSLASKFNSDTSKYKYIIKYVYDSLNRLQHTLKTNFSDSTEIFYHYDAKGRVSKKEETVILKARNEKHKFVYTYKYNDAGIIVEEKITMDGKPYKKS